MIPKFKAFVKDKKAIYDVIVLDWEHEEAFVANDYEGFYVSFKEIELIQWTGFKDKNNSEVYDLDILYWRNTNFLVNFRFGSYQLDGVDPKCWCTPYFYSHVRDMKRVGSLLEPLSLEIDIKPEVLEVSPELGRLIP